jgi:hypothetical protein
LKIRKNTFVGSDKGIFVNGHIYKRLKIQNHVTGKK